MPVEHSGAFLALIFGITVRAGIAASRADAA
jgi:hypothetical protein